MTNQPDTPAPKLRPCPCCGSDAAFGTVKYSEMYARQQKLGQTIFHFVSCTGGKVNRIAAALGCGISNQTFIAGGWPSQSDAAERWNRRVA